MKLNQLILPTIALGFGAVLFLPANDAEAWSLLGYTLPQSQRDFRVYNNFTDGNANNNVTPDPAFPGAQGAVMAIWKGCVEWGSVLHGDGSGDPHQPNGLGSGGANFDPSYQGQATEVGDSNDNIHSEIGGSQGGVLAFTEGAGGTGWRIRYYRNWTWNDGPNTGIPGSNVDLQGVACHEYGHALGMGHSNSGSATMAPSITGTGVGSRSISSDDIAGIQAAYDPIDFAKPLITDVQISGSTITITGANFDPTGNQIWFTQAGTSSDGTPIKVTDLTSNGTVVSATIPGTAGPGDVLVRKNGTANKGLSNAWPTDLQSTTSCADPVTYCSSLPNSAGPGALINYSGSASISANDLTLSCSGLPPGVPGLFFYGNNAVDVPLGDGKLCVSGGIKRLNVQIVGVLGTVSKALDLSAPPFDSGSGAAIVGATKRFQFWYRDVAGGPAGNNTSDGLAVTWCN